MNEKSKAPYTSPERRSYEQLIRRLLKLPGRPAVMLLHHYGYWEAAGDGLDRGLFYREPEGQLTAFAHVSARRCWQRVQVYTCVFLLELPLPCMLAA